MPPVLELVLPPVVPPFESVEPPVLSVLPVLELPPVLVLVLPLFDELLLSVVVPLLLLLLVELPVVLEPFESLLRSSASVPVISTRPSVSVSFSSSLDSDELLEWLFEVTWLLLEELVDLLEV